MEYLILAELPDSQTVTAWNACLDDSQFAAQYAAPEFFEEPYFRDRKPFAVLAKEGAQVYGVATGLLDERTITCGAPGSPHICVRRGADVEAVGRALGAGLRAHASGSTEFIGAFSWIALPGLERQGFRVRSYGPPLSTILLDLSKGPEALFSECSETRRNKIRRAVKAGVEVGEMDLDRDFDSYYDLYSHWCAFKGVMRQPYDVQRLAFGSTANRLVLVARRDGRMIGVSTFRFRRPGIVEYAGNVSRREDTRVRPNDLLLWRAIEWAAKQGGFSFFSMAGAHFFLQKFGGRTYSTFRYSLDLTLLRRHHTLESVHSAVARVYQRLPEGARHTVNRLLGRAQESSE
jgi:hypothetical protein